MAQNELLGGGGGGGEAHVQAAQEKEPLREDWWTTFNFHEGTSFEVKADGDWWQVPTGARCDALCQCKAPSSSLLQAALRKLAARKVLQCSALPLLLACRPWLTARGLWRLAR